MPTVALSMIVKNAAPDLAECLASVAGVVEEIVVADTGSTDESLEIARAAGATALRIPWEDDYSKARNQSLAAVKSDWVLVLDADERLDPSARRKLAALIAHPTAAGFQVTIRNYVLDPSRKIWDRTSHPNDQSYAPARQYPAYIDHENVRLFRRDPKIYFTGRVHETVGWRVKEAGGTLGIATFCIHHFGMVRGEEILAKKILFYRDLGIKKIQDFPQNAQAHFEVGVVELENLSNPAGALAYFERACELAPTFGVGWFFAAKAQFALGRYPAALQSARNAESAGHETAALAELCGDTSYNLGDHEAAAADYRRALKRSHSDASVESKLGLAEVRAGTTAQGLRRLRRAIDHSPLSAELYDRLITVEVWLKNLPAAAIQAERKLSAVQPRAEDFLRAASIRAKLEHWPRVVSLLREGVKMFPDSEALRANLLQIETTSAPQRETHAATINS